MPGMIKYFFMKDLLSGNDLAFHDIQYVKNFTGYHWESYNHL